MSRNFRQWEERKTRYPFHAQTNVGEPPNFSGRAWPRIIEQTYGPFLRVPLPEIGVVLWGFETAATRDKFTADFPHAEVPGDVVGVGQ